MLTTLIKRYSLQSDPIIIKIEGEGELLRQLRHERYVRALDEADELERSVDNVEREQSCSKQFSK